MLESTLEKKVKKYLTDRGVLVYKLSFPGMKGAPDRMVILPTGNIVFFELKRPGQKNTGVTPKQKKLHGQWRARGVDIYVIDDFEEFEKIMVNIYGV